MYGEPPPSASKRNIRSRPSGPVGGTGGNGVVAPPVAGPEASLAGLRPKATAPPAARQQRRPGQQKRPPITGRRGRCGDGWGRWGLQRCDEGHEVGREALEVVLALPPEGVLVHVSTHRHQEVMRAVPPGRAVVGVEEEPPHERGLVAVTLALPGIQSVREQHADERDAVRLLVVGVAPGEMFQGRHRDAYLTVAGPVEAIEAALTGARQLVDEPFDERRLIAAGRGGHRLQSDTG